MAPRKGRRTTERQGADVAPGRTLQDIVGVLLVAVASVSLLALLSLTKGALSEAWVLFGRRVFGWGVYPIVLLLLGAGVLLLWEDLRKRFTLPLRRVVGAEVLFLALLGLSHLLWSSGQGQGLEVAERGGGGGYVGWALGYAMEPLIGRALSMLLLLLVGIGGLAVLASLRLDDLRGAWTQVKARLQAMMPAAEELQPSEPAGTSTEVVVKRRPRSRGSPQTAAPPQDGEAAAPRRAVRRARGLPPLSLLNGGSEEPYGDADLRYRRQVIEETLASFGVPAKVVEINQGPTVTQFGVEPGFVHYGKGDDQARLRKVKVSKIMALQDDLALALAAAPIRIEAPVPGRSVIGIEVPNTRVSLVSLRSVAESEAFRTIESKLRVALGQDVAGRAVAADLAQMPHLLIAGATGSGKSVCVNAIIACLLLNNTPNDLQLVMVDPKMVELTNFNGIPHLAGAVVTTVEEAVRALRWTTQQMDERYRLFSAMGARNLEAYNQLVSSRGQEPLPYIVVLIDELADLMMVAPEEIERSICRIAQLARATGIHLVISTQRPSVDVVTGLIKANFPSRISFAVTSQVDSRVVLDTGGAEKLLGRGDMLYMASDSSKLVRLQGCFVSDDELERLVRFWCEKVDWLGTKGAAPAPWHDMAFEEASDELLEEAIALARGRSTISTSFIQRRLRIGYPRAAHLIDLMEEQGVVGPPEDAGRSRKVLVQECEAPEADDELFPE